jgi:hypothetical protein
MVAAMKSALRNNSSSAPLSRPLSPQAEATICNAASAFCSPDQQEQSQARAKIAYFLVTTLA